MSKPQKPPVLPEKTALLAIAFLEGAMVLSVEILGAKMLAPFFGTSLIVWSSVIGITLTALTAGYYFGGYLSKKPNPAAILFTVLLLATFAIVLMPTLAYSYIRSFNEWSIYTGSFFSALFLLGPPLFLLGTTSPVLIQVMTLTVTESGRLAGTLYAISTVGGILMTFLQGFLLVPLFGISAPLMFCALILLVTTLGILYTSKRLLYSLPVFLLMLFQFNNLANWDKPNRNSKVSIPYSSEGLLGQLKVVDFEEPTSKNPLRHLLINGIGQTRIINNATAISYWKYIHMLSVYSSLQKGKKEALLFGFGAGSMSNELNRLGMHVDAVEIDERMMGLAKKYFYFSDTATHFVVDDARHFIRTSTKKYDLVIFDIANGEVQPSYVYTKECFMEVKNMLKDDGLALFEFQELMIPDRELVFPSICNTLKEAGYEAYYHLDSPNGLNDVMIIASPQKIDFSKLKKENMTGCCAMQPWLAGLMEHPFNPWKKELENARVFTDNQPMLDHLHAASLKAWRESMLAYVVRREMIEGYKLFR